MTQTAERPLRFGALFKIGVGPSSSHTIGPMKAANLFMGRLGAVQHAVARVCATAFGSLAWTGKGHATDRAMMLGLSGLLPDSIDPDLIDTRLQEIHATQSISFANGQTVAFNPLRDVVFDTATHFDRHPNAMRFVAFDDKGATLQEEIWFSVGGGFVEREGAEHNSATNAVVAPFPYTTGDELVALGRQHGKSIAEMVRANECVDRDGAALDAEIDRIAAVMFACIDRGLVTDGELPGGLKVKRRARGLYERLATKPQSNRVAPHEIMNTVSAFAIAVNEENAAGGRVVTAPTNGAAGVVPAVLRYYRDFCPGADTAGIHDFFLTATAIGGLIKRNASISGAEVGCQGEVGSAASMAAAGLAAALGGTNEQIENAAEIAMEHHLGMTCDPIGGLVQIPCIERNAFGAIKAINAASLALEGDGDHRVSLDQVVETMRQTGFDMQSKYRETSRGGLAVNVPEC